MKANGLSVAFALIEAQLWAALLCWVIWRAL